MRKTNNYIATIREFLGFSLNSRAHLYGYVITYDATWELNKQYIKDIFELEVGMVFGNIKPNSYEHKHTFMEWINDMDSIANVEHYFDYHPDYALERMVASKDKRKSEADKLELIYETIYKLLYA